MYRLSDDIPPPVGRRHKYPFCEMAVGQSFEVSPEEIHRVRAASQYIRSTRGTRYTIRRQGAAYRCWRIT
jgi:hypothetical protein